MEYCQEDTLFSEIIKGLKYQEWDLGSPTFQWNGVSYPLVPSVAEFSRALETGGFVVDKLLTACIQLQDGEGNYTFTNNVQPTPQQIISYDGLNYRIISIKTHPTNAYIRITAVCTARGV